MKLRIAFMQMDSHWDQLRDVLAGDTQSFRKNEFERSFDTISRSWPLATSSFLVPRARRSDVTGALSKTFTRPSWERLPRVRRCSERTSRPEEIDEVIFGHGRQAGSGPNPARQVAQRSRYSGDRPGADGQQGVCLRDAGGRLGSTEHLARGIGVRPRGRDRVDESHAISHRQQRRTLGSSHGELPVRRRDVPRWVSGSTVGVDHGRDRRSARPSIRITRDDSDRFALESQQKAEAAQKAGHFTREIAPVQIFDRGKATVVDADEHPRHGTTIETLAKLPLAFPEVEGHAGIITAGSSSGITDGGAALVLASGKWAADRGLKPLAHVTGWASCWCRAASHGHRPGTRTAKALRSPRPRHWRRSISSN